MIDERLSKLLCCVKTGEVSPEDAYQSLKELPFEDLAHTKIDYHRGVRKRLYEVIFSQGKSVSQISDIFGAMRHKDIDVLVTRVEASKGVAVLSHFYKGLFCEEAGCFYIKKSTETEGKGTILVVSAGTSDSRVSEEAFATSTFFGNTTHRLYDVGVAGIHRLLQNLDALRDARIIIVVAGEGALPFVVAGIVGVPVIAVPTSVGYGASFGGLTALLAMLNSCTTVSVMNIDNGFGAAYHATLINRL